MNKLMMKREEKKRGSGGYGVRERNRGRGKERTTYKGICIWRESSGYVDMWSRARGYGRRVMRVKSGEC
jgi:hypothetical protein